MSLTDPARKVAAAFWGARARGIRELRGRCGGREHLVVLETENRGFYVEPDQLEAPGCFAADVHAGEHDHGKHLSLLRLSTPASDHGAAERTTDAEELRALGGRKREQPADLLGQRSLRLSP